MKEYIIVSIFLFLSGCASERISDKCLTYSMSGDTNVSWAPLEYYQSKNPDILYIEISKTAKFIPTLEIIDTEFNQPYKVEYTFDNDTYRFRVEDNYDKYILYRNSYDETEHNRIYITCNRHAK